MKNYLRLIPLLALSPLLAEKEWYTETLHPSWRQSFVIEEVLYEEKSEHQEILIFKNPTYGTVLALDGVIQTTENDEFVYQEMLVHPALLAHGNARNVLIIGGGDGGALREVLRHKTVESATLVEIDGSVITFSKKHLPFLSSGAFDDPRAKIFVEDGAAFVKNSQERFDVIICDSTDPEGPGAVLFSSEFYADCHRLLAKGGIFVNQNGVPALQKEEFVTTLANRRPHFIHTGFYLAAVPTYVGGFMALGWASDSDYSNISIEELKERLKSVDGAMRYYTPSIHKASFALPQFMEDLIES